MEMVTFSIMENLLKFRLFSSCLEALSQDKTCRSYIENVFKSMKLNSYCRFFSGFLHKIIPGIWLCILQDGLYYFKT